MCLVEQVNVFLTFEISIELNAYFSYLTRMPDMETILKFTLGNLKRLKI